MRHVTGVFRYYYFVEDDRDQIKSFYEVLAGAGVPAVNAEVLPTLWDRERLAYELDCTNNMRVLVVKLFCADISWEQVLLELKNLEVAAGLSDSAILARVSVLTTGRQDWDVLLNEAGRSVPVREPAIIKLQSGKLARLSGMRSRNDAYFLCSLESERVSVRQLLSLRLPLLEGELVHLTLLSNLLRDRNNMIKAEKAELDQKLSRILHSNLVAERASQAQVDELERQIEELSGSYGIIFGDYTLVADGICRLNDRLESLNRHYRTEREMEITPELWAQTVEPYRTRLEELQYTREELQLSRESHQAGIEVVRSKVEILNSRSNLDTQEQIKDLMEINTELQKQSLIFQYAAGLIEFIVLAYYSHTLWSHLAHAAYQHIPAWIQFLVVMVFSGNIVYVTHLLAEYSQGEKHVRTRLVIAVICLLLLFSLIFAASTLIVLRAAH